MLTNGAGRMQKLLGSPGRHHIGGRIRFYAIVGGTRIRITSTTINDGEVKIAPNATSVKTYFLM